MSNETERLAARLENMNLGNAAEEQRLERSRMRQPFDFAALPSEVQRQTLNINYDPVVPLMAERVERVNSLTGELIREQRGIDEHQRYMDQSQPGEPLYNGANNIRNYHQARFDELNNELQLYRTNTENIRRSFFYYAMLLRRSQNS